MDYNKKSRKCKHLRDFLLEARGVEPLSWTLLTQASPCSDADCCISPVIRSASAFHHSQEPVDVIPDAVPPPDTCLLS